MRELNWEKDPQICKEVHLTLGLNINWKYINQDSMRPSIIWLSRECELSWFQRIHSPERPWSSDQPDWSHLIKHSVHSVKPPVRRRAILMQRNGCCRLVIPNWDDFNPFPGNLWQCLEILSFVMLWGGGRKCD